MPSQAVLLLAPACKRDATPVDIQRYLEAVADEREQRSAPFRCLTLFYDPADMDQHIAQARDWWPKDAPPALGWESSMAAALGSFSLDANDLLNDTLLIALTRASQRVVAWLRSEGRSTERPNETKADRMRRMNRERVAQYRQSQRATEDSGQHPATVQWQRVKELEAERDAALKPFDEGVASAQAAFMAACEARKLERERWALLLDAAKEEHKRLKGV